MNEVTRIHLGRQAFTIAVDAHRALRAYLTAIERQVDNKDVVEEIELRMAELLTERNVTGKHVILMKDVNYLKQQLGEASDFTELGDEQSTHENNEDATQKRLFRDPDHGIIAGVAAGLATYFNVDPIITRLIFVALTFTGGAGILLYILLWLLVPPALTRSDRLQMDGKAVTVDNIKEAIDRADVPGVANRAGKMAAIGLGRFARICLAIIGVALVLFSTAMLLADTTALIFGLIHGLKVANTAIFPIGSRELLALSSAFVVILVIAVLIMLTGRAMIRQKWGVPGWALAALAGLFIAGGAIGTATSATLVEPIRDRIHSVEHGEWRSMTAFNTIEVSDSLNDVGYTYIPDTSYGVVVLSLGNASPKQITTKVAGGKLYISGNVTDIGCNIICPYGPANIELQIHMPASAIPNQIDDSSNTVQVIPGYTSN